MPRDAGSEAGEQDFGRREINTGEFQEWWGGGGETVRQGKRNRGGKLDGGSVEFCPGGEEWAIFTERDPQGRALPGNGIPGTGVGRGWRSHEWGMGSGESGQRNFGGMRMATGSGKVEFRKWGKFVDGWTGGELSRRVVFGKTTGKFLVACKHENL